VGYAPIYDYSNKTILAPMVRVGTLPFRLLSLRYGADIAYSEEIIAHKLKDCITIKNKECGTIDFTAKGADVFRTNKHDHPNVVQLGSADAITALQAGQVVSKYVNGIDLNMGCPVHFSIQGGMGSALLKKPETIHDILSTLKRNLPNSITGKIRLLETVSATLDLIKTIESTGVSAIAIHARYVPDRPRDKARWEILKEVVSQCSNLTVPLILNGDVFKYQDIQKAKSEIGVTSVMIARGAMWNASVFNPQRVDTETVIREYLKTCIDVGNQHANSKYTVLQMSQDINRKGKPYLDATFSKNMLQLCTAWGMEEYYKKISKERESFGVVPKIEENEETKESSPPSKKIKESID